MSKNMNFASMGVLLSASKLAEYVDLVEPCYYHNGYKTSTGLFVHEDKVHEHVETVLEWFDCPPAWRPVVRVMAQGASYYGEGGWMKGA